MEWYLNDNLFYITENFGVERDHLDVLPEDVKALLDKNEKVARDFLAKKPRTKMYQYYGLSKFENEDDTIYGSIALTDEERDELEKRLLEVFDKEFRDNDGVMITRASEIPEDAFYQMAGFDPVVDKLFAHADSNNIGTVCGIDLEEYFYFQDVSVPVYDESTKEMVKHPVLVVMSDEDYIFCLTMRLTFGKPCTYNRLSLIDPTWGRNIFAQVDGALYGFNLPHDFPFTIVLGTLEEDVKTIIGK